MRQKYSNRRELSTIAVNDDNPLRFVRNLSYAPAGGREMIKVWASMQTSQHR
jgi:hypothetical protein